METWAGENAQLEFHGIASVFIVFIFMSPSIMAGGPRFPLTVGV